MARIDSKLLFVTTSPRTPAKMIPEIALLDRYFHGQRWNNDTQAAFMQKLSEESFFLGKGENDPAFSARDRINRAPKSLGLVKLKPTIELTPAGMALTTARRTGEVLLRQLLKFQLPSPYHVPSPQAAHFWVKPYLELFRLIRDLGSLRFDELKIFALQLTDYHDYDRVVSKIHQFRKDLANYNGSYREFEHDYHRRELREIYRHDIDTGRIKTRESHTTTVDAFLDKKASNMRDYADACVRYLRSTEWVNVSHVGKSLSIQPDRLADVDYFLHHIDRNPCWVDDCPAYEAYLGSADQPRLLADDRAHLLRKLRESFPQATPRPKATIDELKHLYEDLLVRRKQAELDRQVTMIKDYSLFDDIVQKFDLLLHSAKSLYDPSLLLEWNTWRAMTMLDGGSVHANLKFDDYGQPLATAQGNMADIVCDYKHFHLTVEVTLSTGQRQYETEGEPVARHLGQLKRKTAQPAYCLFLAPIISPGCISHFYVLHKVDVAYYGGRSTIVPLPLDVFQTMVEASRSAPFVPSPEHIRSLFEYSNQAAAQSTNETEWFEAVKQRARHWLD